MRTLLLAAVVLTSSTAALPGSRLGPPTLLDMRLSVADGDAVPPNVAIFGGFTGAPDGATWWLTEEGSDAEPLLLLMEILPEQGWTKLTPDVALAPDTAYRLIASPSIDPPDVGVDGPGLLLQTGRDNDEEAPAAPVVTESVRSVPPRYGDSASCGSYGGGTFVHLGVEPVDDVAAYRLTNGAGDVLAVNLASRFDLDEDDNIFLGSLEEKGGDEEYSVVAVDHAGNESEPTLIPISLGCAGSCNAGLDVVGLVALAGLFGFRRRR